MQDKGLHLMVPVQKFTDHEGEATLVDVKVRTDSQGIFMIILSNDQPLMFRTLGLDTGKNEQPPTGTSLGGISFPRYTTFVLCALCV